MAPIETNPRQNATIAGTPFGKPKHDFHEQAYDIPHPHTLSDPFSSPDFRPHHPSLVRTENLWKVEALKWYRSTWFRGLRILLFAYVGLALLLALTQRSMIYYPSKSSEARAVQQAHASRHEPVRDREGEIQAWRSAYPEQGESPANRLMVFHGNAGQALNRTYFSELFALNGGQWEVILFEYPGYGPRSGSPSERSIVGAAVSLLDQLKEEDPRPIFLAGESLGTGVAGRVAAERPDEVAGMVFVTPLTSIVDVGRSHFPWLPVGLLLRDRFDAERALRESYRGPVAFVIAGRDEVVPAELGRRLAEGYEGPKLIFEQEDASHNTLDYTDFWRPWGEIKEFLLQDEHP